ncbi:SUA5-like translation suppressor [Mycoplasmopsis gallinacea]|uniref:L-threonylcarbamoyladenylate synthase n=1 Tax=Mycoplasmopsis gallinacea TaxID=29556 RepID=A0A0D5ZIL4_9BACT|nr:SUA5-like translation suppressor [Mycoplasmopsis gallinacea]
MNKNYDDIYIFTTDTVCGIGCKVSSGSINKLFELKNRPIEKKIMILVSSIKMAQSFNQWNEKATETALKYWPGAYSIIINDQGFRMPNNAKLLKFLEENGPMYVTSANKSGMSPIDIKDANDVFPQVSNVFDFGKPNGKASTIINLDTGEIIERN